MSDQVKKVQDNKTQEAFSNDSQNQIGQDQSASFLDNRPGTIFQRKLQENANNGSQISQLSSFQNLANRSQQSSTLIQLQSVADHYSGKETQTVQKKENNTGLPDNLKSGVENLSGYSMDDVKVHYNSPRPAQMQAHAYAQGTEIHLGQGQEKHLPHEAWHVVQQKQGRVKPTMQMKGKVNVNDDDALEKEADIMGARALYSPSAQLLLMSRNNTNEVAQRAINEDEERDINASLSEPRKKDIYSNINESDKGHLKKGELYDKNDITERLKEGREKDVNLRLKSFDAPFPQLVEQGGAWHGPDVTWDFKHWMADGEMPPDFGYGFPIRTYFRGLAPGDQDEFTAKCKGMRSATNITRIIAQSPLTQRAINELDDDKRNIYNHTRGILEETKTPDSGIGMARLQLLMSNPGSALRQLAEEVINAVRGSSGDRSAFRDLELSLANVSDEIWKEIAKAAPTGKFGAKKEFPAEHQAFGSELMKVGRWVQGEIEDDIKDDVNRVFGKVIRSWGDATASIGYDPYGKMITQSQSSTTDDYGRNANGGKGDGEKAMTEHKQHIDNEGGNAWCDMFASGSMWNLAANYDRYRDTVVTLYVQPDHGAQLGRGNDSDPYKMRVTAAELQLGVLNAFFTKFEGTKDIDERAPLDARNMDKKTKRGGTSGLPNLQDSSKKGRADEVARDFGFARVMGDGSMEYWVKTDGDGQWYKAIANGNVLTVDYDSNQRM